MHKSCIDISFFFPFFILSEQLVDLIMFGYHNYLGFEFRNQKSWIVLLVLIHLAKEYIVKNTLCRESYRISIRSS